MLISMLFRCLPRINVWLTPLIIWVTASVLELEVELELELLLPEAAMELLEEVPAAPEGNAIRYGNAGFVGS